MFCAPLQTAPKAFYAVSTSGCTYNLTLYTSLACPTTGAPTVTAITAPPAATAANCGYKGVDLSSLAVDMVASDEAGRQYVIHPCGAVSNYSLQYCTYPNNAGQQPKQYPSACEITGYCNPSALNTPNYHPHPLRHLHTACHIVSCAHPPLPVSCTVTLCRFFATDAFGYFQPSATTWYALSNGYAYSSHDSPRVTRAGPALTSRLLRRTGSITTFTFICNSTATTLARVQASARIFADPTQCQYIVQLQTSLACQSNGQLPALAPSSGFGGLGYDLGALTGYDIFSAEAGTYNGQFSYISFCITIWSTTTAQRPARSWTYAARGHGLCHLHGRQRRQLAVGHGDHPDAADLRPVVVQRAAPTCPFNLVADGRR